MEPKRSLTRFAAAIGELVHSHVETFYYIAAKDRETENKPRGEHRSIYSSHRVTFLTWFIFFNKFDNFDLVSTYQGFWSKKKVPTKGKNVILS